MGSRYGWIWVTRVAPAGRTVTGSGVETDAEDGCAGVGGGGGCCPGWVRGSSLSSCVCPAAITGLELGA